MKFFISNLLFVITTLSIAHAQIDTSQENVAESKVLLSDIQSENRFRHGALEVKLGLMQISTNKAVSSIQLNSSDQLPFVEIGGDVEFWHHWGLTADFQHAQNALGTQGGPNTTSANQESYQLGPICKVILDQTNVKNFYTIKLQYYGMRNTFKLVNSQLFYAKAESGFLLGVERSIPATELIDLAGGFDLIMINNIKSDSILQTSNKGNGLQFKAEVLYNWTKTKRFGLSYSIAAFFNKFTSPDFEGRDRNTQTYKSLGATYSYLF